MLLALLASGCKDHERGDDAPATAPSAASPRLLVDHLGDGGLFKRADGQPILGSTIAALKAQYGADAIGARERNEYTLRLPATSFGVVPEISLRVQRDVVIGYRFQLEYDDRETLRADIERSLDLALGGKGRPVKRHSVECLAYALPGDQSELSSDMCEPEAFACQRAEVAVCQSQALGAVTVFVQRRQPLIARAQTVARAFEGREWRVLERGKPLPEEPHDPSVTALPDGRLLIIGGSHWEDRQNNAVLYDPGGGAIEVIPSGRPRTREHSATLLADGNVLVAGGTPADVTRFHVSHAEAQIFEVARKSWISVADMRDARYGHSAFLLADGRVLVFGGTQTGGEFLRSSEIFDPRSKRFTPGPSLNQGRWQHAAVVLEDKRILIAGSGEPGAEMTSEVFDPATLSFTLSGALERPWFNHQMALLPDGRAWLVGESYADDPARPYIESELYDPDTGEWRLSASDRRAWMKFTAVAAFGGVLLVGGHRPAGENQPPAPSSASSPAMSPPASPTTSPPASNGAQIETLFFQPRTETFALGPSLPAAHAGDRPRAIGGPDHVLLLSPRARDVLRLHANE